MAKQTIISISREFGSGGHVIAEKIAQDFGLPLYDRKMLEEIAAEKNMRVEHPENMMKNQEIFSCREEYTDIRILWKRMWQRCSSNILRTRRTAENPL